MNTNTGSFVFILNAAFIVILSDAQHPTCDAPITISDILDQHPTPPARP